jgi:hypothetical protein
MTPLLAAIPRRHWILFGSALLLATILFVRWISNWGLVTIHVKDYPLGKVIASIGRQGHVRIESSLDPSVPVSLDVDKVTPVQALDLLSARTEASWRLVFLAAPNQGDLRAAVLALQGAGSIDSWTTDFYPGPPFQSESGLALDPRRLSLSIEGTGQDLPRLLDQAAQKSGVMTALPMDWNPVAAKLPKPGTVSTVIPSLIREAHGKVAEFFYLAERTRRPEGERPAGDQNQQADQGPRVWEKMNADWREQRQLSQIALLPKAEQPEAKKRMTEQKAVFAEMQGLTPEQRRAKWQQMMSNPDRMLQMMDQQLLRQTQRTPEQQINRAVNYLNRKAAFQASQAAQTH